MPKAKPIGLSTDHYTYKSGYACYRLLYNGEVLLEAAKRETIDAAFVGELGCNLRQRLEKE